MRIAVLALSGLGLLATGTAASAASPAYCALYAREYAASKISAPVAGDAAGALQRVQDQAYYRCLNQDEDPAFPETSAYFGADVDDIFGGVFVGGPFAEIEQGDAAGDIPDEPVEKAAAPAKPVQTASSSRKSGSSGREPWSAEWVSWCKEHYRSFNEETGMILTFSGDRKMCA
jgi:hypothetical protein